MKRKLLFILCSALIFVGAVIGLSACDKVQEILLSDPENISFDGSYVTWDRVDGADYYMVSINGGEAVRSNSTTYSYSSGDSFEVTITAVFDGAETSASVTFKPLAAIESLYVSADGVVSWDAVSGANAYEVSVNGDIFTTTDTAYDELASGSNRVRVKPIVSGDKSYYSSYSEEKSIYIYAAPAAVRYDGSVLSWTGNASSYRININGEIREVTGNRMNYDSGNTDFTVEIVALGNHETSFDSAAAAEEFHYLDPIDELFVEDGIIKWNPVEGAAGYKVKVDGVERAEVKEATYEGIAIGRSVDVEVMPFNDDGNYFSTWSELKTVYILETPTVRWNNDLELDGEANNNFIWDGVNAASGYTVRLTCNGELVDIYSYSSLQRYFADAYTEIGTYTIEVKANADVGSGDYYDSRYSEPVTVRRLAAPTAASDNFIVSDRDSLAAGFTVNFNRADGAVGYRMYKDGVALDTAFTTGTSLSDRNVADVTEISEQHYTYMVRSTGEMRTTPDGIYVTLPSLSTQSLSFDITVQASPQLLRMSGYMLSWEPVSGGSGYTVAYGGIANTSQSEIYDLSTLLPGTYSVTVAARGNGGSVLPSNASAPVTITRLQPPTDISITSAANGTLHWTDVSHADGYSAYLDLSETALDSDSLDNMYQFISTTGTTVSMTAEANYYNADGTVYYMTSPSSQTQQFIRLEAPVFPEGAVSSSSELMWSVPSNVNSAEYTPVYSIFSALGEQIGGGTFNGTRYDITYLEGGSEYTFYVKAIGNDTRYLDSDYSAAIVVYKLDAPEITVSNNQYTWSGVTNASSYYLEIDGVRVSDEFHVSGTTYSYTPRFTSAGDHIVKLRAVGDGRYTLDSKDYVLTQKAVLLETPEIEFSYSSDAFEPNGSIIVNIIKPVDNNNGYQYEVAGETVTERSESYVKTIFSTGKYVIRVRAHGGTIDANGVYYIDSLYAGGNAAYTLTLLGQPSSSSFRITTDGAVMWDSVSGSLGYDYMISYDGGEFSEIMHRPSSALDPIDNYKQYKTVTVRVRASGDGSTVISSAWAEWTWTNVNYGA